MLGNAAGGYRKRAHTLYGKEGGKGEDCGKLVHFVSPYMGDWLRYSFIILAAFSFSIPFAIKFKYLKGYWKAAPRRAAPGLDGDNLFLVFANQLYRLAFSQNFLV